MIKVMGIDPGISHLGGALITVNTEKPAPFVLEYADSLRGDLTDYNVRPDTPDQPKAWGLVRSYGYLLEHLEPDIVCCEDNFLQLSPSSFKRLIEVVTMMSYCTALNLPDIPFHLVLPRLAKQIVNADKDKGDKNLVKEGLKICPFLDLNGFDLDRLTEHAVDAILLAVYEAVQLYKSYGWDVNNVRATDRAA